MWHIRNGFMLQKVQLIEKMATSEPCRCKRGKKGNADAREERKETETHIAERNKSLKLVSIQDYFGKERVFDCEALRDGLDSDVPLDFDHLPLLCVSFLILFELDFI